MVDFNRCIGDSSNTLVYQFLDHLSSSDLVLNLMLAAIICSGLDSFITSVSTILVYHCHILSFQPSLSSIRTPAIH